MFYRNWHLSFRKNDQNNRESTKIEEKDKNFIFFNSSKLLGTADLLLHQNENRKKIIIILNYLNMHS